MQSKHSSQVKQVEDAITSTAKADPQIDSKTSKPFFELGQITTPTYSFDFSSLIQFKSLKPVKFQHENQPFATFYYSRFAPKHLCRMVSFDNDYLLEKSRVNLKLLQSNLKFAVCFCTARQIINTLDFNDRFDFANLTQILNVALDLPKIWSDFIHNLGNKLTPYGNLQLSNPMASVLNFLCCALRYSFSGDPEEWATWYETFLSDHEITIVEEVLATLIRYQANNVLFVIRTVEQSTENAKLVAQQLWDLEFSKPVDVTFEGKNLKVTLDDAKTMLSEPFDVKVMLNDLTKLGVKDDVLARILGLLETMFYGYSDTYPGSVPEFGFLNFGIDNLILTTKFMVRVFSGFAQSVVSRLYKTEPFVPSEAGNSSQLVVRDPVFPKYSSKVNLPHYPQALGCMMNVTSKVDIVRSEYVAHSKLGKKDAAALVILDAKDFFKKTGDKT